MKQKTFVFYLILVLFMSFSMPLSIYSRNLQKQLTTLDGLSNNSINCIFQDSEGGMWFGTWDGLNYYNGRDFKNYKYSNSEYSISNNIIRQIEQTDSKHLWIATDNGLNRWNRETEHFDHFFVNMSSAQIPFYIGQTVTHDLICYFKDTGVFYFNNSSCDFEQINGFALSGQIRKFIIDSDNQIHIIYNNGILESYKIRKNDEIIEFSEKKVVEDGTHVHNIFSTNNLFIVSYDNYIKIHDPQNQYPSTVDTRVNKNIAQILYLDNSFLIGYSDGGCDLYDVKDKKTTPLQGIPPNLAIFSMLKGSQDILWVGTDGQGVFEVYEYNSQFALIETQHPVRAFCELSKDKILIGTKGDGLKLYNKKSGDLSDYANVSNGLLSNSVYAMARNKKGDIFIGTEESGLNYISNNKLQKLNLPADTPFFRYVYSIYLTNNDSCIWLGTTSYGLIKIEVEEGNNDSYRVKQVRQYSSSNDINTVSNDVIYAITGGVNPNELWVGTRRGGLFRFDIENEQFENIEYLSNNQQLSNNDVLCLLKNEHNLWVGTSFGLNRINLNNLVKDSIITYTEMQDITNNTIHGILDDGFDNLWFSSNGGLTHFDVRNNTINNFTPKDGLQSNEFSDGAYYKDLGNTFYFGGVNGFNFFQPNKIERRQFTPDINLSSIKILNTTLNTHDRIKDGTLHLSYDEAYTTLTFWTEDYINNTNCEYRYRLLNFSDEWINNGQNPSIVLTKLPPGSYELQVKTTNGDRVWGNFIYTLHIKVAPPWWFSTWAVIIYVILFVIIAYIIYKTIKNRIRLNRELLLEHIEKENQKKIHESKLNFFTNVAHEFFTPLSLIYGPAQHLIEKDNLDNYTKRYLRVIKNNADRMQKLISELMDFRKVESGYVAIHPEKIELDLFINYVCDNYSEIAEENSIEFQIEKDNLSTIRTDRSSLEKILFNLISNAFKYTPENGYISVKAYQEDNNFHFIIRNSGKGLSDSQMLEIFNQFKIFDKPNLKNNKSTGIGLSLVKSLINLLGGTINVDSKLREYVEFSIQIPPIIASDDKSIIKETNDLTQPEIQIQERKDISILIVEDEKNIRVLLKDILAPYYKVYEAEDGRDALNMIRLNMPDIIISDILMPNMDGMELIRRLKAEQKTAHIPVINISAKNSINDQINAFEQGTDLFITKPFHPKHVLVTIQNLINKQSRLKDYFTSSISSLTVKDGIELHQEDEYFLNEIISYIEKNIDDEMLSPSSIADAMGISKASLYRKLKDITEKTPSELVRSIRLNHASKLLISTKMTVQEIMFKCGFTNKSYFYREFAKQYNSSPNEYRQNPSHQQ